MRGNPFNVSSFAIYVDIAGRVTEADPHGAPLVAAAVAIDPRARDVTRSRLAGFPKWKDATAESFERVVGTMESFGRHALALRLNRTEPAWRRFFQDGKRVQRQLSQADGSSIAYLKPGTVMRTFLLGNATVRLLANCAKNLAASRIVDAQGRLPIFADIVNDGELSDDENIDVYRQHWSKLVTMQNTFKNQGFSLVVESVDFATEQDEPLLLLPDYLAGCFLACENRHVRRPTALPEHEFLPLATRLFAAPGVGVSFEDFTEEYAPTVTALADDPIARAAAVGARRRARTAGRPSATSR